MRIPGHIGLDVVAGREQFPAERAQEGVFPRFILYFGHASEADDAGETVPPFAGILHRFGEDGETHFLIRPDGVQLMPFRGTMEIDPAVGEEIIHRDTVRVSVLSVNGKDSARSAFQDRKALFPARFLLEPAHRPENDFITHAM